MSLNWKPTHFPGLRITLWVVNFKVNGVNITWELIRNENSSLSQRYWIKTCSLTRFSVELYVHSVVWGSLVCDTSACWRKPPWYCILILSSVCPALNTMLGTQWELKNVQWMNEPVNHCFANWWGKRTHVGC